MKEFSNKYFDYLNNELKGINLTAIRDREEFYNKQILDSVNPLEFSQNFKASIEKAECVIDIGFGGGFPIIPMAYKYPDQFFLGFEARKKKVTAVEEIIASFELTNVNLFHQRIENVLIDVKNVVLIVKAVGTCSKVLELIRTMKPVEVFFYKAKNFYEIEGEEIKKLKRWQIIEECEINVPNTDKRLLIGFRNKNVLRGTSKNLVNLSKFL
jgi:16S rRNA (guanine527-N7)-methyltransferase